MDVIRIRVFRLSLMGEAEFLLTELPYNSIYTLEQLRDVFQVKYYPIS